MTPKIRALGVRTTRFSSVFSEPTHQERSPMPVTAWRREVTSPTTEVVSNGSGNIREPMAVGPRGPPAVCLRNPMAQPKRLGPILTDGSGRRFDRPLNVGPSVVDRFRKASLCFYLFLRGECVLPTCRRNHSHPPLSSEEFDALWLVAREKNPCKKNGKATQHGRKGCVDVMCVYGHGRRNDVDD